MFDPSNARTVYAVLWEQRQGPWENGVFTGPGSGVFKSTDGGDHWRPIDKGLPTFADDGLGRIGITIAESSPKRLFATVQAERKGGLYRSDDGGESWRLINDDPLRDASAATTSPRSRSIRRTPTSSTRAASSCGSPPTAGRRSTRFAARRAATTTSASGSTRDDPRIMLVAADQGAIITVNGGESWSSWYNQPTAQFYHVTTDNAFPYRVCGGQQESGSACVQSRGDDGQITFREWHPVGIEEYGYAAPDPLDPDIVYGGKVTRYDRRTDQTQNVGPKPLRGDDYRVVRTMPILFSPLDPHTLYFASNTLWKTTNGGESWDQISPDLTRKTWEVPTNVGKYIGTPGGARRRPRRHLHDRAVVQGHQRHLDRHRRRLHPGDARRRADVDERDAARASGRGPRCR